MAPVRSIAFVFLMAIVLVREVKKIDTGHPVISVDAWMFGVPWWEKYTPSLDAYGINVYGHGIHVISGELAKAGVVNMLSGSSTRPAWHAVREAYTGQKPATPLPRWQPRDRHHLRRPASHSVGTALWGASGKKGLPW